MLSMSCWNFRRRLAPICLVHYVAFCGSSDAVMEGVQYSLLVTYATFQCDDLGPVRARLVY